MVILMSAVMKLTAPAGTRGQSLRVLWKTLSSLKAKGHVSENWRLVTHSVFHVSLSPSHTHTDVALKLTVLPGTIKVCVCILQVKVMNFQDELESGKRQRKSSMTLQQQVQHYRNRLLQKVHTTLKHNQLQQKNTGFKKIITLIVDNCLKARIHYMIFFNLNKF